jgi:hypothetical protein
MGGEHFLHMAVYLAQVGLLGPEKNLGMFDDNPDNQKGE